MSADREVVIAPSILAADFRRLGAQVDDALAAGVRRIHVDVMDGMFVPNISMGPLVVEALILAIATTLLASVYPAWKASRMTVIDALRRNR